jgi:DNA adenine methylase Dam
MKNYFEPYVGSGVVFLKILEMFPSAKCHINDLNIDLMNVWSILKSEPTSLVCHLRELDKTSMKTRKTYMKLLKDFNDDTMDRSRRAAVFIYFAQINFHNFISYNRHGLLRSGYSSSRAALKLFDFDNLEKVAHAIKHTLLSKKDACEFLGLDTFGPGDFIFLDPPYLNGQKMQYCSSLDESDLTVLFKTLDRLHRGGAKFALTLNEKAIARKIFKKFKFLRVQRKRPLTSKSVRIAPEIIIHN